MIIFQQYSQKIKININDNIWRSLFFSTIKTLLLTSKSLRSWWWPSQFTVANISTQSTGSKCDHKQILYVYKRISTWLAYYSKIALTLYIYELWSSRLYIFSFYFFYSPPRLYQNSIKNKFKKWDAFANINHYMWSMLPLIT